MRHLIFQAHADQLRHLPKAGTPVRRRLGKAVCRLLLTIVMGMASLQQAQAVVPYRSADDYGPSLEARSHLPACRRAAIDAMAGAGKIESESFVQRNDAEYFRFVMRQGLREVLIICDGRVGLIRRQIDIWGDL